MSDTQTMDLLVVDDDTELLKLLKTTFEMEGFRVRTATAGPEGLKAVYEHPPDAVILDIAALRTLSPGQVSEGLVEAYKTGLVASAELAALVEQEAQALLDGDQPLLAEVADSAARTKAQIVSSDFRESGLRRILNFGHTYGHGVEGACRFGISHGQAVAEGMKVAAELSAARGLIPRDLAARITETVRVLSPEDIDMPRFDDVWEIMRHDKKIKAGRLVFVLLEGVGRAVCVDDVSREELKDVVDRVAMKTRS